MRRIIFKKIGEYSYWENDQLKIGKEETENEKRGGGLFLLNRQDKTIANYIFILNGIVKDGGGIYLNNCKHITITNCLFVLNYAKWGGGIYVEKSSEISLSENPSA